MAGESFYKYMAYEKAAASVENAPPLARSRRRRRASQAAERRASRSAPRSNNSCVPGQAEQLEAAPPSVSRSSLLEVLGVSGIGTKTAAMLFTDYGIASLADLEAAIAAGTLLRRAALGQQDDRKLAARHPCVPRTSTPYAACRRRSRSRAKRWTYVREGPPLERLLYAGSLRRAEVTVGDIDLVCTSQHAADVIAHFTAWERAEAVFAEGPTKASIWLPGGLQIDLRVLPDHLYGNLLQHFTGSREHNIKLREYAVRASLRVSENGILNLENGEVITCTEEAGVYAALGMQYIPSELRSGLDEIELARAGAIPELVEPIDLRGDFHMHTVWSDGDDTLEAMIAAAAARGYEYHAISDHSQGRGRRFGLAPDELLEQRALIEELARASRHSNALRERSRHSCRTDPSTTPTPFLPNSTSSSASVHTATNQSREEMTARLIRACENPYVTIIGHPTGRRFEGFRRIRVRLRCGFCGGSAHGDGARDRRPSGASRSSRAAGAQSEDVRRDVCAR